MSDTLFLTLVVCFLTSIATGTSRMTGGWSAVPNHDLQVQEVSKYASDVISDRSNSLYHKKLIHVHEASRQVVSGLKYNLTLDLGTTICRKNEVVTETQDRCSLKEDQVRCLSRNNSFIVSNVQTVLNQTIIPLFR